MSKITNENNWEFFERLLKNLKKPYHTVVLSPNYYHHKESSYTFHRSAIDSASESPVHDLTFLKDGNRTKLIFNYKDAELKDNFKTYSQGDKLDENELVVVNELSAYCQTWGLTKKSKVPLKKAKEEEIIDNEERLRRMITIGKKLGHRYHLLDKDTIIGGNTHRSPHPTGILSTSRAAFLVRNDTIYFETVEGHTLNLEQERNHGWFSYQESPTIESGRVTQLSKKPIIEKLFLSLYEEMKKEYNRVIAKEQKMTKK